jgi:Lipoprotein LpqB beta-propeller domain
VRRLISVHLPPHAARPRLPLSMTVALLAVPALTLAVALSGCGAGPGASGSAATSDTVPPYYAETVPIQPPAYDSPLNVSIRSTATGEESAALRALPPYQSIGFVVGTGKPNWWIAGAQPWHPVNYDNSAQPAKLYLATMEATTMDGNPFTEDMLTPLPVAPMPAGQLIDGTAVSSGAKQLAAATVSPDGKRLALVVTQADTYQVSVYPVAGDAPARTWSGRVSPVSKPFTWGFSLTWLSDDKTLAVGIATGDAKVDSTVAVSYLNTGAAGSSLAEASRTVTLSFPAQKAKTGTPDGCYGAPVASSDGSKVLCPGAATYPVNAGGATEVGLWVFSARTGALTAAWNKHTICCALSGTDFPRLLWVSPHGTLVIASGMSTGNQGAQLFLRAANGTLQQLPWKGLVRRPNQAGIIEPSIAW